MFENIENLKIISVLRRQSKRHVHVVDRNTHSFFIRVSGIVSYDFPSGRIMTQKGDVLFIPKGSTYTGEVLSESAVYTAIHFEADFSHPLQAARFSLESFYDADYICSHMSDLWNFGTPGEKHQCHALFYSLLAYLSAAEAAEHRSKGKFLLIEPAETYLRAHLYDCDLKAHKLPRLCGISGTYFRQIFSEKYGTTPQHYILSKRIAHARAILSCGDFHTIAEVAQSVGFNDPLYFSKVFKKHCGSTPSELIRD